MEILVEIFGKGKNLSVLQMCMRAIVVFCITLVFVRISGKRTFGMRAPMDNVITILLGALLSRVIVGATPFIATVASGLLIIILYRVFASLSVFSKRVGFMVKGKGELIYKDGTMIKKAMKKCVVTEEDLMEELRINSNLGSLKDVEEAYVERNGEISIVIKNNKNNIS